ncbi:MAG: hypothetical protein ACNYPI_07365 [Arenicellales bacterium WSBS_2016_MAG_OTU3]
MEIVAAVSAMLGVAWASGINLYAAVLMLGVLMLGVLGNMGSVDLPCEN